jgi:Polysaccharide deacetylase
MTQSFAPRSATEPAGRPRFVVSLDFELMWGVRETRTIESYGRNILGARAVIPRLLDLFLRHRVHATWATVGMVLFERKRDLLEALPDIRPSYDDPGLDPYPGLSTIGETEQDDPFHFGLGLARQIVATEGMELGSHTFSHYFALEPGQTREQFAADMAAAVRAGESAGARPLSLVFPRNQVNEAYLDLCREAGIVAFRGTEGGWIHSARAARDNTKPRRAARLADTYLPLSGANASQPAVERHGLVDVPSSRFLRPVPGRRLGPLEWLRVRRITSGMETAARSGRTFHLWWHPHNFGARTEQNVAVLETVLRTFEALREEHGMESLTMAEVATEARG